MSTTIPTNDARARPRMWGFVATLLVAIGLAYGAAWRAPFVFDDEGAILANPTITTLWPLHIPLSPPGGGLPVSARPVANLSLALNFAISGTEPWSYHALNVALHGLAALALFSLVRRTLAQSVVTSSIRTQAGMVAFLAAALWSLHPLATAAVSYVSQRTEILAAFFLLMTLNAAACAATAPGQHTRRIASAVAVLSCLLGMASKETMTAAPLLVLLYDRIFIAGSFAAAWRSRWRLHASLMSTWIVLGWLVVDSSARGGTAGFGVGVAPSAYLATQGGAVLHYLNLVVWPHPLVFDYGVPLAENWRAIALPAVVVAALLGATILAIVRQWLSAFPAAVFFAVLAPSSSFVPVATQTIAEHRMYLPLAAVLVLAVAGLHAWLGRRTAFVLGAVACGLGIATYARNTTYLTEEALWRDTIAHRPDNARAHNNLATLLFQRGELAAGLAAASRAAELRPDYADAHLNLARALLLSDRVSEALGHARTAYRIIPGSPAARDLLGEALMTFADACLREDQLAQAIDIFAEAVSLDAGSARGHTGLGNALLLDGRSAEALPHFDAALAQQPPTASLLTSRAIALLDLGRLDEACTALGEALRLDPAHRPAREVLDGLP